MRLPDEILAKQTFPIVCVVKSTGTVTAGFINELNAYKYLNSMEHPERWYLWDVYKNKVIE